MNRLAEYVGAGIVVAGLSYLVVGAMLQDVAWPLVELARVLGG